MKILLYILPVVILALTGCANEKKSRTKIEQYTSDIIIPEFKVTNVTMKEALQILNELSRKNDKNGRQNLFRVTNAPGEMTFTADLKKIPSIEVARILAGLSHMTLRPEDGYILIVYPNCE